MKTSESWVSHWIIHSRDSFKKHWFIHVMKRVESWVSHWIIHSRDSFKNTDSSSNETSQSEWVIESLIEEIHSKTLIHPVMKRVNLEWVIESFIQEICSKNTDSSSNETSESWVSHWIIHSRDSFKNTDSSSNETSESWVSSLNHSFKRFVQKHWFIQ